MGKLKDDIAVLVDEHIAGRGLPHHRVAQRLREVADRLDPPAPAPRSSGDREDGTEPVLAFNEEAVLESVRANKRQINRLQGFHVPMDRDEVVKHITKKIAMCQAKGMTEAANVLTALVGEIEQHLEERPLDVESALRAFYTQVYESNVKAGWWSDLATGEPKKRSVGELFILFVTELAEAYVAWSDNLPDDKLPDYPGLGVELGDLQIRLADFCGALMAGRIVAGSRSENPGANMFHEICAIADRYEQIRKTPEAVGEPETGDYLPPADVAEMITAKLEYNAKREDHKIENRKKPDGKKT